MGNRTEAGTVCIQGLQILESRGYDSCGVVSITTDSNDKYVFELTKFASSNRFGGDCIKRMTVEGAQKHKHFIGIGHTRWATHGDKTDVNAHPHFDHKMRVALVHNGIIANYHDLKIELNEKHGIKPKSGTDTEIVAILIGVFLDQGSSLSKAIEQTTEMLEGAYSFVLISILEPETMYIFKNTGTMVIGLSDGLREGSNASDLPLEESKELALLKEASTGSDSLPHQF